MRLRLDYVSPLPPVASGIADYSADLLPALSERAEVRVVRLPGQAVAPELAERYRPVGLKEVGAEGRLPLYQMGNNPFHEAIWESALVRPGVLTLHDLVLHHLLGHRTLGQRDFPAYQRALEADHGWIGREASWPRRRGQDSEAALFALPAHRSLLVAQRGVIVHNRWAAEKIAEDAPEVPLAVVPMGIPLPPPADPAAGLAFRRRLSIPPDAPLLGSFGFQTPIKRTGVAIAALAHPRLAGAHLLVVGQSSPALDLEAEARRAGVAERVHQLGFVSFEEFEAAIAAVDVCLNLRYPTAGETSASLLRVLAVGRPALVSDYAQFADLPDAVALKVPLGEAELAELVLRLSALLEDRERLAAMSRAARELVAREHAPERAADEIVAACRAFAEREPPGWRPAAVPLPTSLVRHQLPARLRFEGAERPWRPGERRALRLRAENTGEALWLATEKGPGGVALELTWQAEGRSETLPWLPLPRDVPPGGSVELGLALRRPLGASVRLRAAVRALEMPEVEGGEACFEL
ncbi:MAG: glycosyltransferase family 4 protein [Thermoanaerobaculia bacterium]